MANIIIVDDSNVDLTILSTIIGKKHAVITYSSVEAFEEGVDIDQEIHLIVTDLNLDGKSGREVVIWGTRNNVPVIVLTGTESLVAEAELLNLGAADYIRKPYQPEIVMHRINLQLALHNQREQISIAQDQLVQSEKMAALGQLAAGVAHEINNPVGFINTNNNIMGKYLKKIEHSLAELKKSCTEDASGMGLLLYTSWQSNHNIENIFEDFSDLVLENTDGINRVRDIVKDLKEYSHLGEQKFEICDIETLLRSAVNLLRNEIKYKAEVDFHFCEQARVDCIASQLSQVFVNLIVNACHAIAEFGKITISTKISEQHLKIKVSDSGQGIAPEKIANIFDPFFTTKPVGEGTGLGLAISKSIIERHNGKIKVSSIVGTGTQFSISLPIKQPILSNQ